MRTIKFRAWDKKKKRMFNVDVFDLNCGDVGEVCITREKPRTTEEEWYKPEEVTVMQFTGLIDKNGKECFEADLIRHILDDHVPHEVYEIYWDYEELRWLMRGKDGNKLILFAKDFSVVGNKYEGLRISDALNSSNEDKKKK